MLSCTARESDRVLSFFLRVHDWVEHAVGLRCLHQTVTMVDRVKSLCWSVPSLNIQRFHIFRPNWSLIIWIRNQFIMTVTLAIQGLLSRSLVIWSATIFVKIMIEVLCVHLVEVWRLVGTSWTGSVDLLLAIQILVTSLDKYFSIRLNRRTGVLVDVVIGVDSILQTSWGHGRDTLQSWLVVSQLVLRRLFIGHKHSFCCLRHWSWSRVSNLIQHSFHLLCTRTNFCLRVLYRRRSTHTAFRLWPHRIVLYCCCNGELIRVKGATVLAKTDFALTKCSDLTHSLVRAF